MLYYLFDYFDSLNIPGAGLFDYISFRAGMAALISLLITITFGEALINKLRSLQVLLQDILDEYRASARTEREKGCRWQPFFLVWHALTRRKAGLCYGGR